MNIKIDLKDFLRDWQKDVLINMKRFNILVIHRRAWKTVIALTQLIIKSLENKGLYWYISPTYRQSKAIAWDLLNKLLKDIPWIKFNISELVCELPNWSKIRLFGSDYPDSLRWLDIKGVIFDEYAQQPVNIYSEIIFPMINANKGWCTFIWTPKWKNNFYKIYQKWLNDDKYYTKLLTVKNTWLLSEEQLNDARSEMTAEEYEQEYNCSFTASIKWAYYKDELEKMRAENRIIAWLYDPLLPVYTFWDLWISDNMAILFVQIYWKNIRIIDSISINWKWFDYFNRLLKDKNYIYEKHYFPHDIAVRELSTWQSRLEIVKELFWHDKVETLPRMWVIDWINAVRRIFHNIYIDEKLEDFINAINLYKQKYDDKKWIFLDSPEHDWTSHYADSLRYMWIWYNLLLNSINRPITKIYIPNYNWI